MNEQRNLNTPYEPAANPEHDTSVGGLLRQLTREVPSLFTKELALAKAELSESIRATKAGAASVATGGAVLLAGFIVLLMSAVYFLGAVARCADRRRGRGGGRPDHGLGGQEEIRSVFVEA